MSSAGAAQSGKGQNVATLDGSAGSLCKTGFDLGLGKLSAPATRAHLLALGGENLKMKLQNDQAPRAPANQSAGNADVSIPIFKDGDVTAAQRSIQRPPACASARGCEEDDGSTAMTRPRPSTLSLPDRCNGLLGGERAT
jgi:hypothetical protein